MQYNSNIILKKHFKYCNPVAILKTTESWNKSYIKCKHPENNDKWNVYFFLWISIVMLHTTWGHSMYQIEKHCMWHPLLAYAPTTHVTIYVQSNDLADTFIQSILEMRTFTSDLSYKSQQYLQYHNAKFPSRPKLKQKYTRVLKSFFFFLLLLLWFHRTILAWAPAPFPLDAQSALLSRQLIFFLL